MATDPGTIHVNVQPHFLWPLAERDELEAENAHLALRAIDATRERDRAERRVAELELTLYAERLDHERQKAAAADLHEMWVNAIRERNSYRDGWKARGRELNLLEAEIAKLFADCSCGDPLEDLRRLNGAMRPDPWAPFWAEVEMHRQRFSEPDVVRGEN